MQVCNFYLLRHGKVDGEPALNGHTDRKVAPVIQQKISQALLNQQVPFEKIISSPLHRCADLAKRLKKEQPKINLSFNDQIQEMSFGQLDGKAFETIKDKWPLLEAFWHDPANNTLPQGETLTDFHQRIVSAWSKIIKTENKNTLIIAHGGVIRMILADTLQIDWKNPSWHANLAIGNASITHIQVTKAEQTYISVKGIANNILN